MPVPARVVALTVYFNVALGLFNLIPIPPLDGYNVVLPLLPPRQSFLVQRYAQYGYIALLLLSCCLLIRAGQRPARLALRPRRRSIAGLLLGDIGSGSSSAT